MSDQNRTTPEGVDPASQGPVDPGIELNDDARAQAQGQAATGQAQRQQPTGQAQGQQPTDQAFGGQAGSFAQPTGQQAQQPTSQQAEWQQPTDQAYGGQGQAQQPTGQAPSQAPSDQLGYGNSTVGQDAGARDGQIDTLTRQEQMAASGSAERSEAPSDGSGFVGQARDGASDSLIEGRERED